jgi:PKD repeat protein
VPPQLGAITAPVAPVSVGTSVSTSVSLTDAAPQDVHAAIWAWGDGVTSSGTVIESNGSGSVTGSHVYTVPGVYIVTLTVTDDDGGSVQETFEYIVIYDPDGGFVTGGGWINSPAGAHASNPSLVGKATFGFNSKYAHGANVPTGNTEFQFKVASLAFKSSSYDWLVVAGAKAQYKGAGKINGSGDYRFMLTAIDGDVNGGGETDTFRIRIWNNAGGGIVYDNQLGEADNADPSTALGGGSIVIHKN